MTRLAIATLHREAVYLEADTIRRLEPSVAGTLLCAACAACHEACPSWHGMIDRRPVAVDRCVNADDVCRAAALAADHVVMVSIRGGGNTIGGSVDTDDAPMTDLSQGQSVEADPGAKPAGLQPGATLDRIDSATRHPGLATPAGITPPPASLASGMKAAIPRKSDRLASVDPSLPWSSSRVPRRVTGSADRSQPLVV